MWFSQWGILQMMKAVKFEDMINVFSPFPLEGERYKEFYVDTSRIRNVMDASKKIVNSLRYGINPYMKLLFMGHKGCGKSTEILHIAQELQDKYEVVTFSVAQEIEMSGIQYVDVIFTIMNQIIEFVSKNDRIQLKEDLMDRLIQYWKSETVLQEVLTEKSGFNADAEGKLSLLSIISANIKGVFQTGAETKREVRTAIEPKIGTLIRMINDSIRDINEQLQMQSGKEILLVIEDLDKLEIADARHIFVEHRKSLLTLQVKTIFSFPIYMVYTDDYSMIQDDFDECVLYSMIKVANKDKTDNEEGINILKEVVYKRMDRSLIQDDTLTYMIRKSGGALRDLFQMLSDAAFLKLEGGSREPIGQLEAEIAVSGLKSKYQRYISTSEQMERLIQIYLDPIPEQTDSILSSLLKSLSVIEYNGERWCGVHPILVDFLKEKNKIDQNDE